MITVNIDKARALTHTLRRSARAVEFAPLDVEATIPFMAAAAEAKRQGIRDKYTAIQAEVDAATSVDALLTVHAALRDTLSLNP